MNGRDGEQEGQTAGTGGLEERKEMRGGCLPFDVGVKRPLKFHLRDVL